jgi:pimeloyl-ACP methyl ester carboxylesterase
MLFNFLNMANALQNSPKQCLKFRVGRRAVKAALGVIGLVFLLCFVALASFPGLSKKFVDPTRLGGAIHIISTNGFTLRWVEKPALTNASLDLVFVHGTPGGAGVWAEQFRSPFPAANLFAYDRPGFGGSKPSERQPHLQTQAGALATFIRSVTTNRVVLIGHSYGSPIVLLTALEYPERVRGVLLIGGDVDPALEKPLWIQYVFGWRCTSWLLPHRMRQCNRELLSVRADLVEMAGKLPTITVPVIMLHGGKDSHVPVANVAWLRAQFEAAGKTNLFAATVLSEYNHFIPWEHPDAVDAALRELAARVQSDSAQITNK